MALAYLLPGRAQRALLNPDTGAATYGSEERGGTDLNLVGPRGSDLTLPIPAIPDQEVLALGAFLVLEDGGHVTLGRIPYLGRDRRGTGELKYYDSGVQPAIGTRRKRGTGDPKQQRERTLPQPFSVTRPARSEAPKILRP